MNETLMMTLYESSWATRATTPLADEVRLMEQRDTDGVVWLT